MGLFDLMPHDQFDSFKAAQMGQGVHHLGGTVLGLKSSFANVTEHVDQAGILDEPDGVIRYQWREKPVKHKVQGFVVVEVCRFSKQSGRIRVSTFLDVLRQFLQHLSEPRLAAFRAIPPKLPGPASELLRRHLQPDFSRPLMQDPSWPRPAASHTIF